MVTRLYTPLIPYPPGGGLMTGAVTPESTDDPLPAVEDATQAPPRTTAPTVQQQAWLARQQSTQPTTLQAGVVQTGLAPETPAALPELKTVAQHTRQQQITASAILNDFAQTADLLGAPEPLKAQVQQYLGIVEAEGQLPQPNRPLIESVLQRAAQQLDDHVTQTLGQPATVVTEWVNALLSQDVDWRMTAGASQDEKLSSGSASGLALPEAVKRQVGQSLAMYQASREQQAWPQARQAVDQALNQLSPYEAPALKGKFLGLQAKLAAQQGDWTQAIDSGQQAVAQWQQANQPEKLGKSLLTLGQYYQAAGQPLQASDILRQGLQQLPPQAIAQHQALHLGLGQLALQQGQPTEASQWFQQARQSNPDNPPAYHEATHGLGVAFQRQQRPQQALQYYREALAVAKASNLPSSFEQTTRQVASLYLEQGKLGQAQRLLSVLKPFT